MTTITILRDNEEIGEFHQHLDGEEIQANLAEGAEAFADWSGIFIPNPNQYPGVEGDKSDFRFWRLTNLTFEW